jgi:hypothetical protein
MGADAARGVTWHASALAAIVAAAAVLQFVPVLSGRSLQSGRFTPSADGLTVKDTLLHVTWAADLNLPASMPFGLAVHGGGSMTYQVVRRWIAALNASGYGGRRDWTIPAMPATDATCSVARGPNGNSFGFDCMNNPMGSLYYRGLGVRQPNTAVPMPPNRVGPFRNLQPYLYWSANGKERAETGRNADRRVNRQNGNHAFSFNTGWQGGNVSDHVMYVLPMIRGSLAGATHAGTDLQPSADGQTVYDPISDVTWLANANLAADNTFGVNGIVKDGAMTRVTADDFINAMNRYQRTGYLGQSRWQLPPTDPDPSCTLPDGGYNCTGSPLGALYHRHLLKIAGRTPGEPVVPVPDMRAGPFHNLMPYLYWGCAGNGGSLVCSGEPAAPGFQFSFSFGNGFTGTDVVGNSLYVMVYAIDGK